MRGATPKAGLAQWLSRERARPGTTYATFVPNEGKGVGNGFSQVCSWVGIRKSARSPALIRLCRQHAAARQHECERWGQPAQGQVAAVGIALIVEGRGREWRRLTAVCGCNHWSLSSLDGASVVALSSLSACSGVPVARSLNDDVTPPWHHQKQNAPHHRCCHSPHRPRRLKVALSHKDGEDEADKSRAVGQRRAAVAARAIRRWRVPRVAWLSVT